MSPKKTHCFQAWRNTPDCLQNHNIPSFSEPGSPISKFHTIRQPPKYNHNPGRHQLMRMKYTNVLRREQNTKMPHKSLDFSVPGSNNPILHLAKDDLNISKLEELVRLPLNQQHLKYLTNASDISCTANILRREETTILSMSRQQHHYLQRKALNWQHHKYI